MKRSYSSLISFVFWTYVLLLFSFVACDTPRYEIRYKEDKVFDPGIDALQVDGPQLPDAPDVLAVPSSGAPKAQIELLWEDTVRIVREDLASSLDDAAYLERRDAMLTPWFTVYFSHREAFAAAGLESSEIVSLVNHVYGFSSDPEKAAERNTLRTQFKAIEEKITAIRAKINKIP